MIVGNVIIDLEYTPNRLDIERRWGFNAGEVHSFEGRVFCEQPKSPGGPVVPKKLEIVKIHTEESCTIQVERIEPLLKDQWPSMPDDVQQATIVQVTSKYQKSLS